MTRPFDRPGFLNARSMEGLPTTHGQIQAGRLYRSANPTGEPAPMLAVLADAGIATVIDLRSEPEVRPRPSILAGQAGYRNVPMVDPRMLLVDGGALDKSLLEDYCDIIDHNAASIVEVLKVIAHAPAGGVLVHCAAGKDRTGIMIAIALTLAGVPEDRIVADFAATQGQLADYFAAELAAIENPVRRQWLADRQHSHPEVISGMLRHIDERHGGVRAYVRAHGFDAHDEERLVARLTGPSDG